MLTCSTYDSADPCPSTLHPLHPPPPIPDCWGRKNRKTINKCICISVGGGPHISLAQTAFVKGKGGHSRQVSSNINFLSIKRLAYWQEIWYCKNIYVNKLKARNLSHYLHTWSATMVDLRLGMHSYPAGQSGIFLSPVFGRIRLTYFQPDIRPNMTHVFLHIAHKTSSANGKTLLFFFKYFYWAFSIHF